MSNALFLGVLCASLLFVGQWVATTVFPTPKSELESRVYAAVALFGVLIAFARIAGLLSLLALVPMTLGALGLAATLGLLAHRGAPEAPREVAFARVPHSPMLAGVFGCASLFVIFQTSTVLAAPPAPLEIDPLRLSRVLGWLQEHAVTIPPAPTDPDLLPQGARVLDLYTHLVAPLGQLSALWFIPAALFFLGSVQLCLRTLGASTCNAGLAAVSALFVPWFYFAAGGVVATWIGLGLFFVSLHLALLVHRDRQDMTAIRALAFSVGLWAMFELEAYLFLIPSVVLSVVQHVRAKRALGQAVTLLLFIFGLCFLDRLAALAFTGHFFSPEGLQLCGVQLAPGSRVLLPTLERLMQPNVISALHGAVVASFAHRPDEPPRLAAALSPGIAMLVPVAIARLSLRLSRLLSRERVVAAAAVLLLLAVQIELASFPLRHLWMLPLVLLHVVLGGIVALLAKRPTDLWLSLAALLALAFALPHQRALPFITGTFHVAGVLVVAGAVWALLRVLYPRTRRPAQQATVTLLTATLLVTTVAALAQVGVF